MDMLEILKKGVRIVPEYDVHMDDTWLHAVTEEVCPICGHIISNEEPTCPQCGEHFATYEEDVYQLIGNI